MNNYDKYNVRVIEDVKDVLGSSELLKDDFKREDIYLLEIPEEFKTSDVLVRLNYVDISEDYAYGDKFHADLYVIQVDVWVKNKVPLGISNKIRDELNKLGFIQLSGSFDGVVELGKVRDSRRYEILLEK